MKRDAMLSEQELEVKQREVAVLKLQISELLDDQKEREAAMKALVAENRGLKLRNINTAEFRTWSAAQFAAWIVSLDPHSYAQYEEKLTATLEKEGVDGECIDEEIDKSDLNRWGISQYKHCRHVLTQIKALVAEQEQSAARAVVNEGAPTAYLH